MSRKLRLIVTMPGEGFSSEYVCDNVTTNKYLTKMWNYDEDGHEVEITPSFQPEARIEIRNNMP
jgi:hypothetical protein